MKTARKPSGNIMRKYYQLLLVVVCFVSIVTLLIYRHEYYRLRYVLEVLNFFGKPGLSEIEFCGPGFNATMLSEILRNSSMEVRETPPLFQQIDENFYSYSSFLRSHQKYENVYKSNAHNIDTIAVGKAFAKPNFRCNIWLENMSKPKPGKFSYKLMSAPIGDYQLYVFHCSMAQNLGKPVAISFYLNDPNTDPTHAPINRVIQVNTKRKTKPSSSVKFMNNFRPAVCIVPNRVPIVTRDSFIEFLVFHHLMGANHFTIYDSMVSEDVIRRLNLVPADITRWEIQFFPLNYPFMFAKAYEVIRKAVELDCLFRHFRVDREDNTKASHAVVLSWDEFLVPRLHSNIKAILEDFDPTSSARSLRVQPLMFCLNQKDDNSEVGYPDIMKKTHYYLLPKTSEPVNIRNLDSMSTFDDIFHLDSNEKDISKEILAVHKYTECLPDRLQHGNVSNNVTQIQLLQHKFEGAMLKFGESLVSHQIYRLYRSGQIWEKTSSENVRDML